MANYNADIRVGITGKTQLNALEKQLGRINRDLNKINKGLKAQSLTINTKAANRALDQLDRKINKLNRSISVNANVKERRSDGGGGGGAAPFSFAIAQQVQTQQKALSKLADTTVEVRDANNKLQQVNRRADKFYGELNDKIAERNDLLKQQAKDIKDVADVETSRNAKARTANQNRIFGGQLSKAGKPLSPAQAQGFAEQRIQGAGRRISRLGNEIDATRKKYENLTRVQRSYWNQENKRVREATAGWERYNDRLKAAAETQARQQKLAKGFGTGAGIAGASALGGVPVLGDAVTGGLAAGLSGGSVAAGALGGAIVGLGVALVGVTADITKFNNELALQQRALANTVSTSDELKAALEAIEGVSQDFLVPIGDATQQFTKLNAAARASGFTVKEVEEVYRGLAAANAALGGDSERLQGILLATQQVFSKGKVQAEELRGQIGERLAGAFAKFAESAGLSTSELDKALEKGEVSLEDFVRFSKSLLEEYEEDAKKIADAPENAAARLKVAMDNLRRAMGPILKDIGNAFLEMANQIVFQLTRAFNAINAARTSAARQQAAADRENLQSTRADLQTAQQNYRDNPNFLTEFEFKRRDRAVKLALDNVRGSAATLQKITALNLDASGKDLKAKTTTLTEASTGGGGSGGRASKSAADEAAREAKRVAETLRDRTQLIERLEKQLEIQRAGSDLEAQEKELELAILEINQEYNNLLSEETNELIRQNTERARALDLELAREEATRGMLSAAQDEFTGFLKQQPEYQGLFNDELTESEQLLKSAYETVANGLTNGIKGLIEGTKDWSDVLSDVLSQLGNMLLQMGTKSLGIGLGIPGFAEGGRPPISQPAIVGERGPELFIPDSPGTVLSHQDSKAALSSYTRMSPEEQKAAEKGEDPMAAATAVALQPIRMDTRVINGVEYATVEQMEVASRQAAAEGAKQGAKIGEAQMLRRLRMNPATRRSIGL